MGVVATPGAVVVAQRVVDVQRPRRAGDGDVEEATLLLEPSRSVSAMSEGKLPSEAFSRCTTSHSSPLAEWTVEMTSQSSSISGGPARSPRRAGGFQGQVGGDVGHRRPSWAAGDERVQIGQTHRSVVVGVLDQRGDRRGEPLGVGTGRLAGRATQRLDQVASSEPVGRTRPPAASAAAPRPSPGSSTPSASIVRGRSGPDAVEQLQQAEPRQLVAGVVGQPEQADQVLDVGRLEEPPPYLT